MNTSLPEKKRTAFTILLYIGISLFLGKMIVLYGPSFPIITDSLKYIEIATSITNGEYAAIKGIIYPPGYPAFLAIVYTLLNTSAATIFAVHFLLLSGIASLTFLIAQRFFNIRYSLSLLAGLTILVWPYMILYSILIMSEVVYIFFLLSSLYLLLAACTTKTKRSFAYAGVIIGITTLIRPITLLLPFWFIGLYILWHLYKKKSLHLYKEIGIGIALFIITLLPWSLYMYANTGVLLPVSSHLPHVLDKSYNTLSYEDAFAVDAEPSTPEVIKSKVKNFFVFWNPGAGGYQAQQVIDRFPAAIYGIHLYKIGFFTILLLAFASLLLPNKKLSAYLLWGTILYIWLLHTVLYPYPRYMLPTVPLIIILAVYTLDNYRSVYSKITALRK